MAQSSWIDQPLNLETRIAAMTSSISAALPVPATRARRWLPWQAKLEKVNAQLITPLP
jgi:hypothetical protein